MRTIKYVALSFVILVVACMSFVSCSRTVNVPGDTKHLGELHQLTSEASTCDIDVDKMALFVDYSNCISSGMSSSFYQSMVSPLTAAAKEYWSIKGDEVRQESGNVYSLLNNVTEVNYAALDKAVELMAERGGESVLLTDGELFTQTSTKNNPNNPYMHEAFKKWLLKGHDIHIIAEPYVEKYNGSNFSKKRFYIIFTDDRLVGNVYDRICKIVSLDQFPEVDEFHLSGNYPWVVPQNGKASILNENIAADVTYGDSYEIQDWQLDWKNIQLLVIGAVDDEGNPLPNGGKLMGGLRINRNAYGCYRISDIDVRVTNINADYFDLYNQLENGQKVGEFQLTNATPIEQFLVIDKNEFKKHSMADIYFDATNFSPQESELDGYPFNYFKIEIVVKDLENILDNNIDMFNFDSVVNKGQVNVSISESLKNCVYDPELVNRLKGQVLYTIYVKSNKY